MLRFGDITIIVARKKIRSLRLTVSPPNGEVKISAPHHLEIDAIHSFVIKKLSWIKKHRTRIQSQSWISPPRFKTGEKHSVWGKLLLITIIETSEKPRVEISADSLTLFVRPQSAEAKIEKLFNSWLGQEVVHMATQLLDKWISILNVPKPSLSARYMKSMWGSCNPRNKIVKLNTELAKRDPKYLEYVLVHELIHLIEVRHNKRFYRLMSGCLPDWKNLKKELK